MMVSNRITNIPTQVICSEDIDLDESNILPQGQTFDTILQPQKEPVSIVELGRRLRKCARLGNTEQVHDLMTKGAPFTTDWLGTSALHLAAMNNHLETCEVLLRAGISRDARTKVERTPLHLAAYEGHVAICELLLLNKAEVDPRDMLKMTPLHWAVEKQHDAVIELLLQHGADPTVVSKFDKTPISIAVELNRLDLAHLLQLAARLLSEQTELGETDEATLEATQHLDLELQTQVDVTNVDPMPIIMPECKTELIEDPPISQSIEDSIIDESGTNISNDQIDDEPQILKNASSITSPSQLSTLQLLQAHGITMLPTDEGGLVNNAIQSGRTLVLSEAGKLVLAEGKKMNDSSATTGCGGGDISNKSTAIPIIRPQRKQVVIPNATLRNKKVITLTHEQFMAITKSQGNKPLLKKVSAEAFKKAAETAGVKYSVIPPLKTSNTATAAQPSPPSQQQQSQTPSMKKINDKATSASASVATKEQSQRSPMKVINPAAVSGILSTTGKPKINITALTNQAKELETVKSQLSEALTLIEQLRAQLNEKESENERLLAQIKAMDGEPQENPIID